MSLEKQYIMYLHTTPHYHTHIRTSLHSVDCICLYGFDTVLGYLRNTFIILLGNSHVKNFNEIICIDKLLYKCYNIYGPQRSIVFELLSKNYWQVFWYPVIPCIKVVLVNGNILLNVHEFRQPVYRDCKGTTKRSCKKN